MKRALGGGNNRHAIIGMVSQALGNESFEVVIIERKAYGWLAWATDLKVAEVEPTSEEREQQKLGRRE